MWYSIFIYGELQTTCRTLEKASLITEMYKRENTFPDSEIEIREDLLDERAAEEDLLSQLLKDANICLI